MRPKKTPEIPRTEHTVKIDALSNSDRDIVIGMRELADSVAEKRANQSAQSTEPLDNSDVNQQQKLLEQLHLIATDDILPETAVREDEDLLEEFLVEFQESSTLSQEEKDTIIADIIDRTKLDTREKESLALKLKQSIGKAALKVVLKFKRAEKNEDPDDEHELEFDDPDPERQEIIEIIREADAIDDREARIIALTTIGQKYKKGEFVDLALLAARTMQDSIAHEGRKARNVQQTKKAGVTNSAYNQLLLDISNANTDTVYGLIAARRIDMPWLRNKTVAGRLAEAPKNIDELKASAKKDRDELTKKIDLLYKEHGGDQAYNNGDIPHEVLDELDEMVDKRDRTYYDITQRAADLDDMYSNTNPSDLYEGKGSKKYGREAAFDQAEYLTNPDLISKVGLRNFLKKQRLISEMAIEQNDEEVAQLMKPGLLKNKTLKTITKNNARQIV